MNKYFSLPGYWTHFFEIQALIQYRQKHPEYFYTDRIFNSAYDCPPKLVWNGGRINGYTDPILNYQNVYDYYYSLSDFNLRHVFTNMIMTHEMINDQQCNNFINTYYRPQDYVIINNNLLHEHLLHIIPPERFIYSATLGLQELDTVNSLTKTNILVLNYRYNNNNDYIQSLTYPNNIEVICGELCVDNCPYQFKHYMAYSKFNAHVPLEKDDSLICRFKDDKTNSPTELLNKYLNFHHAITNERVEQLSDLGVQYFKISGRERPTTLFFEFAVYYLVLPKYQEKAKQDLLLLFNKIKLKYYQVSHQRK